MISKELRKFCVRWQKEKDFSKVVAEEGRGVE